MTRRPNPVLRHAPAILSSAALVGFLLPKMAFVAIVVLGYGRQHNVDDLAPLYLLSSFVFGPALAALVAGVFAAAADSHSTQSVPPGPLAHPLLAAAVVAAATLALAFIYSLAWLYLPSLLIK